MHNMIFKGLSVSAATVALALFAFGASAQDKKTTPAPKPKPPAACKTIKKEADCKARTDCEWVAETKDAKGKVKTKAACKAKPKAPVKKDEKKK